MSNKHWIKIGVFALIIVSITALSLAWVTNTSLAQGPDGGRGRGRGGQGFGQQNGGGWNSSSNTAQFGACLSCMVNLPPAVPGDVPAEVVDALNAVLADEHNAYNTYQAVMDQFGTVRPFANIQQAEAHHIEALEFLFERYNLPLPEIAPLAEVPQFASIVDACSVGAEAEVANFGLYDSWIATVQNYPDVVQVFTALRDASEFQHLVAFERCAG